MGSVMETGNFTMPFKEMIVGSRVHSIIVKKPKFKALYLEALWQEW